MKGLGKVVCLKGVEETLSLDGLLEVVHRMVAQGEQRAVPLGLVGLPARYWKGQGTTASRLWKKSDRLHSLRVSYLLHFRQAMGRGESRSKDG